MYVDGKWNEESYSNSILLNKLLMYLYFAKTMGSDEGLVNFIINSLEGSCEHLKPIILSTIEELNEIAIVSEKSLIKESESLQLFEKVSNDLVLFASVSPDAFVLSSLPSWGDEHKSSINLYGSSAHAVAADLICSIVKGVYFISKYDKLFGKHRGETEPQIINYDLRYLSARLDWERFQLIAKYGIPNGSFQENDVFRESESAFNWNGEMFLLKRQAFDIFHFMWDNRECSKDDLRINVWKRPELSDDAFKKAISRTNSMIEDSGFYIEISGSCNTAKLRENPAPNPQ